MHLKVLFAFLVSGRESYSSFTAFSRRFLKGKRQTKSKKHFSLFTALRNGTNTQRETLFLHIFIEFGIINPYFRTFIPTVYAVRLCAHKFLFFPSEIKIVRVDWGVLRHFRNFDPGIFHVRWIRTWYDSCTNFCNKNNPKILSNLKAKNYKLNWCFLRCAAIAQLFNLIRLNVLVTRLGHYFLQTQKN